MIAASLDVSSGLSHVTDRLVSVAVVPVKLADGFVLSGAGVATTPFDSDNGVCDAESSSRR